MDKDPEVAEFLGHFMSGGDQPGNDAKPDLEGMVKEVKELD